MNSLLSVYSCVERRRVQLWRNKPHIFWAKLDIYGMNSNSLIAVMHFINIKMKKARKSLVTPNIYIYILIIEINELII